MLNSFYGGRQGQNFEIKKVFETKVDLEADLKMAWQSPIAVGDYVLISYGLPGGIYMKGQMRIPPEYVNEELEPVSDVNYDSRKEIDINAYGLSYNATLWQKIYVEVEDYPEIGVAVDVIGDGLETIYCKEQYGLAYKLICSMTGETPLVRFADVETIDCDDEPYIIVDKNDSDFPVITLYLPQSQRIGRVDTVILDPVNSPKVDLSVDAGNTDPQIDINNVLLTFSLPRSSYYHFSNIFNGNELDGSVTLTPDVYTTLQSVFQNARNGDYYIERSTGYIYYINTINKNATGTITSIVLDFRANLSGLAPDTFIELINTYETNTEGEYVRTEPYSITTYKDNSKYTDPKYTFYLPRIPNLQANYTISAIVNSTTPQVIESEIIDENTLQFNFKIPQGPLKVIGSVDIAAGGEVEDTTESIGNYLTSLYGYIAPDELIAVNYDEDGVVTSYWFYCYNYIEDSSSATWGRVTLTGGVSSIIENTKITDETEAVQKVYSAAYVNQLEDKITALEARIETLIADLSWKEISDLITNEDNT